MTCKHCNVHAQEWHQRMYGPWEDGYCPKCRFAKVPDLRKRIAELEAENADLKRQVAYWQEIHGPRVEGFGPKGKQP